jgi:murein DD-endopeptidase MepM/ murein hydrolase activator NlpD
LRESYAAGPIAIFTPTGADERKVLEVMPASHRHNPGRVGVPLLIPRWPAGAMLEPDRRWRDSWQQPLGAAVREMTARLSRGGSAGVPLRLPKPPPSFRTPPHATRLRRFPSSAHHYTAGDAMIHAPLPITSEPLKWKIDPERAKAAARKLFFAVTALATVASIHDIWVARSRNSLPAKIVRRAESNPAPAPATMVAKAAHAVTGHVKGHTKATYPVFAEPVSTAAARSVLAALGEPTYAQVPVNLKDFPGGFGRVTSVFGERKDPFTGEKKPHDGDDLAANVGTPFRAGLDGTVIWAGWWSGYGRCVIVDSGQGAYTLYGHLSAIEKNIKVGSKVEANKTVIGEVGASGRATGPNLHFETRIGKRPTNAFQFIHGRTRKEKGIELAHMVFGYEPG